MRLNQRKCPECNKVFSYSNKYERNRAEKNKTICREHYKGNRNPFYNKKHTHETILFLKNLDNKSYTKTKEFRHKQSVAHSGEKNNMYGKSVYKIWIDKYGKEIADKKHEIWKKKVARKGENNGMYGKPSPHGSGNGWSGWYKNWYFRSLHELSYMINVIERFNLLWESAEIEKLKIPYTDWDGGNKNYYADFLINNKFIVEIKPKRLFNSTTVNLKKEGAELFCEKNNLIYKLICPPEIKKEIIIQKINNGDLIFLDKYKDRINEY